MKRSIVSSLRRWNTPFPSFDVCEAQVTQLGVVKELGLDNSQFPQENEDALVPTVVMCGEARCEAREAARKED